MKNIEHVYKYIKQFGGVGRYGEVELEVNLIDGESVVIDNCTWNTMKSWYSNFHELDILKVWKHSAIEAAESILRNYLIPSPIEIKIKDVVGIYVDTFSSLIGAAVIIGIFNALILSVYFFYTSNPNQTQNRFLAALFLVLSIRIGKNWREKNRGFSIENRGFAIIRLFT